MDPNDSPKHLEAFTVTVQGPTNENNDDHKQELLTQLKDIPNDAQVLRIDEDTPSDTEWTILGEHFSRVKDLEMNTGWNEELNDERMPLHWPLERLLISSACGEVFKSPFVLQGRVKHLILLLTCGLRFEGPTSTELIRAKRKSTQQEEAEAHDSTAKEGKLEITYLPDLVAGWLYQKHSQKDNSDAVKIDDGSDAVDTKPEKQASLETLEIIENDAIDTFIRMAMGLPHVMQIKSLYIRSTAGLDFGYTPELLLPQILPQLARLQTLTLVVGDVFTDESLLPTLYKHLPPNLLTFRFHGPVSLAKSEHWKEWVEAFSNPEFLPNLTTLSFKLELCYGKDTEEGGRRPKISITEAMLHEGRLACDELYSVMKERGVIVEEFHDAWSQMSCLQ